MGIDPRQPQRHQRNYVDRLQKIKNERKYVSFNMGFGTGIALLLLELTLAQIRMFYVAMITLGKDISFLVPQ